MMVLFGVLCLVLSSGSIYSQDPPKNVLNIGFILNADDNISRMVISLAVQKANVELAQHNYRLEVKIETLEESSSFYVIRNACNLLRNGLVAVISPISEVHSRHISSFCSKFHIPHLVTSCRFPESSDIYPMDVHLTPNCDQYARIIYNYISQIEIWRDMILIHSSDNCILKFENLLNQFESRFKMKQWVHHDRKKNKQLLWELSKSSRYHYFLVDIPYWQITDFLIMASVHNMTDPQYSFIFTDWDASLVDITAFKINNEVNITSFSIINSSLMVEIKKNDKNLESYLKNIVDAERALRKVHIKKGFMSQSSILFDSVNMLAKGIIQLGKTIPVTTSPMSCSSNKSWYLGPSLVNAISSVDNYEGITGKIVINENGQRTHYNLTVMALTEDGFEQSGYWVNDQLSVVKKKSEVTASEMEKVKKPLRVTTIDTLPFVFYKEGVLDRTNYDTNIEAWSGFCIDLLKEIGKDLGLNFTIHLVKDNKFGIEENVTFPNGTAKWNGMIGELISKEADLVVAPMTISYEREKVIDFTTPFMSLGLSILFLRPEKEAPGLFSFLSPLSPKVWAYTISAYIGVSVIIFLISHITPYEWLPTHPCDSKSPKYNQFNLLNSLWFAVGALVRQGLEFCPQASSTRMVSGAWWFFTLIIISTYTANLAAFLTVEQLILPIKSVEDLVNQTEIQYGTLKGGASEAFFENALIPIYKNMSSYMKKNPHVFVNNTDAGVKRVLNSNGKYAFLLESAMNDYYVQRNCKLIRVGDLLDSKGYGIGFPIESPLRDKMTKSILKLEKSQKIANLYQRWWNEINVSEPCDTKEKGSALPGALNFYQIGGIFFLLGIGFIAAAFVSILELYVNFQQKRTQWKMPFKKFMKKELKFAMQFMSSSKKPTKPGIPHKLREERLLLNHHPENNNEASLAASHLLSHSTGRSEFSPNPANSRHIDASMDSPCIEGSDYFGSSHDTLASIPNSKYLWNLNNDL